MSANIYVCLLICLLGLVLYLTRGGSVLELARISFAVGLLVSLYAFTSKVIHF